MSAHTSDVANLAERLAALEAQAAVRQVLHRYMELCDVTGSGSAPAERADALGQLFCEDATWQGIGSRYALKFGHIHGREAIVAMLMGYLPPHPHFQFNVHFLAAEQISTEGSTARGQWLMQQLSRYDAGYGEAIVAALKLEFRWVGDTWLISTFTTQRLDVCRLADGQGGQS